LQPTLLLHEQIVATVQRLLPRLCRLSLPLLSFRLLPPPHSRINSLHFLVHTTVHHGVD
jgi:hypothetical protein